MAKAQDGQAEQPTAHPPLAYNRAGEPIELAVAFAAFRVVYARQGPPQAVQAPTGGPLYIDPATTHDELRGQTGAGKFSLVQVDADWQAIDDAEPAYIEFTQGAGAKVQTTTSSGQDRELVSAVLESNKQLQQSCDALAKALAGAVNSLAGNGLKPEKAKPEKEADDDDELDLPALAEKWGPLVMMIRGMWNNGGALPDGGGGANGGGTNGGGHQ